MAVGVEGVSTSWPPAFCASVPPVPFSGRTGKRSQETSSGSSGKPPRSSGFVEDEAATLAKVHSVTWGNDSERVAFSTGSASYLIVSTEMPSQVEPLGPVVGFLLTLKTGPIRTSENGANP